MGGVSLLQVLGYPLVLTVESKGTAKFGFLFTLSKRKGKGMDTFYLDTGTSGSMTRLPCGASCLLAIALIVFTLPAFAWDEQKALDFIMANNSMLRSYRMVSAEYAPVNDTMSRMLEYTTFYGRAGAGGTDYRDQPLVIQAGVQINVPLASTKERRQFAMKAVEERRAIDEIRGKVMLDLAQLRQHEADLAATAKRLKFYEDKSGWLKKRVEEGYDDVAMLWDIGQKLNEERAASDRLTILLSSQQFQVAHYAGERWEVLMGYLKGLDLLPSGVIKSD